VALSQSAALLLSLRIFIAGFESAHLSIFAFPVNAGRLNSDFHNKMIYLFIYLLFFMAGK